MRQIDVINAFRRINQQYGIKRVTIRNDNGSQFIANNVKQYLRTAEANQEFTHIATPEENAYIEAFTAWFSVSDPTSLTNSNPAIITGLCEELVCVLIQLP